METETENEPANTENEPVNAEVDDDDDDDDNEVEATDEGSQHSFKDEEFANVEEDLEEITEQEIEDLFNKNTASFRCLAQILISRSSLLRHPLYHFPPLVDPGLDKAFNYVEPEILYDDVGCAHYKKLCDENGIVPISRVLKFLPTDTLDLKFYGLTFKQIRAIMQTLLLNRHVKNLILQDNWMSPQSVYFVSELIRENSTIEYLNMRECRIKPEGAEELNEGIMMTLNLQELDLSFNSLGNNGLKALESGLIYNSSIRVLNLSHNKLGEEASKTLELILLENNSIEELNLGWNDLFTGLSFKNLCNGLTHNKNITHLNLSWNSISAKEAINPFRKYIKQCETLQFLDLSNNRLTGVPLKMLRTALAGSQSLISVKLGNNLITPDEAMFLAKVFIAKPQNPLEYMDLENAFVNKEFVPVWKKITKLGKNVLIGGILSNYKIYGPDLRKLLFERARFLAQKPKKKKKKRDFGHFILSLPDTPLTKQEFLDLAKKFKMKTVDTDLKNELISKFPERKNKVNVVEMKAVYMSYYPDTILPEKKKKGKKGKGKKGKKGKDKKEAPPDGEQATETPAEGQVVEGQTVQAAPTEAVAVGQVQVQETQTDKSGEVPKEQEPQDTTETKEPTDEQSPPEITDAESPTETTDVQDPTEPTDVQNPTEPQETNENKPEETAEPPTEQETQPE